MTALRVAVIVSKDKSDLFFANHLMQHLNVVAVVVENQRSQPDTAPLVIKALKYLKHPGVFVSKVVDKLGEQYRKRFADYHKPEFSLDFGEAGRRLFPGESVAVRYTQGVNDINAPENVTWLQDKAPDIIAVCGASIFGRELIELPRLGVLNLHGGLSQRYRGLFTTDWAFHNQEPEYVGATVHYVAPGIDDGDILYQGRPVIASDDNPHSLYEKVVRLGVKMMAQAIADIENGDSKAAPLETRGALYLASMYDVKAMNTAWANVRNGVIDRYLAEKATRDVPVLKLMVNRHPGSA